MAKYAIFVKMFFWQHKRVQDTILLIACLKQCFYITLKTSASFTIKIKVSVILAESDYRSSKRGTCQREKFEQQVTEGAGDGSGFYEAQVN